jgi:glyoxylase-like metal-dependent hydrolase (beta-lactamase superfamily II)
MTAIPVRLGTPIPPSHVTGYLFASEPVTIVDPGPRTDATVPRWEQALGDHGLGLRDVEQIVLTHQHWDHVGAAADIHARSGARVLAPPGVRPYLNDFAGAISLEVEAYEELMRLHGVPGALRDESLELFGTLPPYVGQLDLDGELRDGDVWHAGGGSLMSYARPGHSPTDTIFVDLDGGGVLTGDHLLADFPPVFMPKVPSPPPIQAGLNTMLASLQRTGALGVRLGLPAHGSAIVDVPRTAARWAHFYRRHDARILSLLNAGPRGVWQIVTAMHDTIREGTALYKLLAVLGPLEVLESEGVVERQAGIVAPAFSRR